MRTKHFFLPACLALYSVTAFSQQAADLELAAECAGMSAAVKAAVPEPASTDTDATKELRQVAGEIHDRSHKRAYELGGEVGMPPTDVAKRMISAMVMSSQVSRDQLWPVLRAKCEQAFVRRPPT